MRPYGKKTLIFFLTFFFCVEIFSQPKITSFSPTFGPVGASVTINGSGFNTTIAGNKVFFGSVNATVTAVSANALTVKVPVGAGFGNIVVLTDGLISYSTASFDVTFPQGAGSFNPKSFAKKIDVTTAAIPYSVATADIDGDGKVDLIVANTATNNISIFRNTSTPGNISFSSRNDLPTGNSPHRICVADLNGDGKPDIIVTNYNDNTISVLENFSSSGAIVFTAKTDFPTGLNPETVAAGDLDGDGIPELVITNSGASTITVLRNSGTGGTINYSTRTDLAYEKTPAGVAIGDFDGDGKVDVCLTTATQIIVFQNTSVAASLGFSNPVSFNMPYGYGPNFIVAGDLNADGRPDMAVVSQNSVNVTVFYNRLDSALAPVIKSFSPDTAGYKDTVHIIGNHFTGVNLVSIGGFAVTSFQIANDTAITAIVGTGGNGAVLVSSPSGVASLAGFVFAAPILNSFNPLTGNEGTVVTVTGKYFSNATQVAFGGTKAASFSILSDSVIVAIVGPGSSGSVSVTTPSGVALHIFRFFSNCSVI